MVKTLNQEFGIVLNRWLFRKKLFIAKLDNEIIEGRASIPGKYIIDFIDEDEKLMEERYKKMLQPMNDLLKDVNWSDYTQEKMLERYEIERKEHDEKN
jgi:hypothetical protein